ncbi:hypothetical protein [Paraburkholderia agricolaris]|uniref:hypothetical protein n=1 Tax=Paraburkholderia agricolaris TaxID=2152888 RepID=UPI001290945A|nr:hypothetical protein [Paraburkholderia agricolaris]
MQNYTCIIHFPGDDAPPFETRVAVVHEVAVTAGALAADAVIDTLDKTDMAAEMQHAVSLFMGTCVRDFEPSGRPGRIVALFDIQSAFLAGFVGRVQQVMMHAGIGVTRH